MYKHIRDLPIKAPSGICLQLRMIEAYGKTERKSGDDVREADRGQISKRLLF